MPVNQYDSNGAQARMDDKEKRLIQKIITISAIVATVSGILQLFEGSQIAIVAKGIFIASAAILLLSSLVGYTFGVFDKQS